MELAPPDKYFITANGQPLRSIMELRYALEVMGEHVFEKHVTPEKNDFANWLRHVFQRDDLADAVQKARTIPDTIAALDKVVQAGRSVEELTMEKQDTSEHIFAAAEDIKQRMTGLKEKMFVLPKEESAQVRMEKMRARFQAFRELITELRKEGRDMLIPEMLARQIKAKLLYLEYTNNEEDIQKVIRLLDELQQEIDEAKRAEQVDVRKELQERLAQHLSRGSAGKEGGE